MTSRESRAATPVAARLAVPRFPGCPTMNPGAILLHDRIATKSGCVQCRKLP